MAMEKLAASESENPRDRYQEDLKIEIQSVGAVTLDDWELELGDLRDQGSLEDQEYQGSRL